MPVSHRSHSPARSIRKALQERATVSPSKWPGEYIAFYLYDNGYTWLAKPVAFTVTKPKPIPAPTYKGTFAGGLSSPAGIAVDGKGDVWVTDSGANRIVEYSASGRVLREFGRSGSGNGELDDPTAIAVDASGNVYVADTGNNRAEEFNREVIGFLADD